MNETMAKSFFVKKKKPLHVQMELKKGQKQGRNHTTQNETNLIQLEYPTYIHIYPTLHYTIKYVEQIYRVLFLYQVSLLFCLIMSTLFMSFFQLHSYMQRFFIGKLFTLVYTYMQYIKIQLHHQTTTEEKHTKACTKGHIQFHEMKQWPTPIAAPSWRWGPWMWW